jgi:hypothetical protein
MVVRILLILALLVLGGCDQDKEGGVEIYPCILKVGL